jgi:hypothetical protein
MTKSAFFLVIFACSVAASAQLPTSRDTACTGSLEVDGEIPFNLQGMVRASQVILAGTVVQVFPPAYADSTQHGLIHTQSILSVEELLFGSVGNADRIALAQMGGAIPPIYEFVAGDPIVKKGERYVLFLHPDSRRLPPNASGFDRFTSVGLGSGMVKIDDGKVQFSCKSNPELKEYDNTELNAFLATVRKMISQRGFEAPPLRKSAQ